MPESASTRGAAGTWSVGRRLKAGTLHNAVFAPEGAFMEVIADGAHALVESPLHCARGLGQRSLTRYGKVAIIRVMSKAERHARDAARLQAAVSVWIGRLRAAGELRRERLPDNVLCESQEGGLCAARLHEEIQVRNRPAEARRRTDWLTLA